MGKRALALRPKIGSWVEDQVEIVASPVLRKIFGINMRFLRRARGFSQEQFADRCRLHRTYIGSLERGERNVSIDNMERIAAALGTTVADMLRTI